jgi:hypothetical protein
MRSSLRRGGGKEPDAKDDIDSQHLPVSNSTSRPDPLASRIMVRVASVET